MSDDFKKLFEILSKVTDDEPGFTTARDRYQALRHLWKIDDPEWLNQRKAEWRLLVEDGYCDGCTAKELKVRQTFYLTGEEPLDGMGCSPVYRVILTPFTTEEEADAVVKQVTHPGDRSRVLSGYMELACSYAKRMPWLRERIRLFIDGVLGRRYQRFEMEQGRRTFVVSPEPTSFCSTYAKNAIKLFRGELEYSFAVDTVPYFLSVLPEADKPKIRKRVKLTQMFDEAARVLEQNEADGYAVELARDLMQHKDEIMRSWKLHEHLDQN